MIAQGNGAVVFIFEHGFCLCLVHPSVVVSFRVFFVFFPSHPIFDITHCMNVTNIVHLTGDAVCVSISFSVFTMGMGWILGAGCGHLHRLWLCDCLNETKQLPCMKKMHCAIFVLCSSHVFVGALLLLDRPRLFPLLFTCFYPSDKAQFCKYLYNKILLASDLYTVSWHQLGRACVFSPLPSPSVSLSPHSDLPLSPSVRTRFAAFGIHISHFLVIITGACALRMYQTLRLHLSSCAFFSPLLVHISFG